MKTIIYLLFCLIPFTLAAQTNTEWVSNRDHSEVMFQVTYLNVSELTGRFTEFSAKANLDEKGVPVSLNIKIDPNSVETGNKMRDGHLKGSDFFEAHQYPAITFVSSKVSKVKDNNYKVDGVMTIKGNSKPMVIEFTVTDSQKDTWGYENKFVKFKSKLNRKDFKINWNKTLDNQKYLVSDEVTFWGVFQIQPASSVTPPSKHMIPDTQPIRKREIENRKPKDESSFSDKVRKLINME